MGPVTFLNNLLVEDYGRTASESEMIENEKSDEARPLLGLNYSNLMVKCHIHSSAESQRRISGIFATILDRETGDYGPTGHRRTDGSSLLAMFGNRLSWIPIQE